MSPGWGIQRFSTSTDTGAASRTVTIVPAGSVAALRSPAITTAVPPAAPVVAPTMAPFFPPMSAPRIAPPTARSADFARAFTCRRFALSIDGLRADRKLRSVGEDQRVEPDSEPRPLLDFAATLHERHRSDRLRAGGNGDPSVSHDVPGYATVDAILDVRTLGRDRRLHAQANHRRCRDDELVELRWRRCFRTWSNLGNLSGCRRRRRCRRCDLRDLATSRG